MLNKKTLLEKLEKVINSSEREIESLNNVDKNFINHAQLELSKTVISANKNIVSAVNVATKLITEEK